jgi:hypothetical protein
MNTKALFQRNTITTILILQFIPLILFPLSSFTGKSQEWWLPVLLSALSLYAAIEIAFRRNEAVWPWDLVGFSQGFNIISRLMMVMPHATSTVDGAQVFNTIYVVLTAISIAISAFMLWYIAKPETRTIMLSE